MPRQLSRNGGPKVRESDATFYRYAWWFHFKKLVWDLRRGDELFVIAATLQTKKKKTEFLSALEQVVDQQLHCSISRRVLFWKDDADRCLQAADYGLWAVMRDLERGDNRAREQVKPRIRSERGPFPRWLRPREERLVSSIAARRLIPLDALGEALAWSLDAHIVADETSTSRRCTRASRRYEPRSGPIYSIGRNIIWRRGRGASTGRPPSCGTQLQRRLPRFGVGLEPVGLPGVDGGGVAGP